MKSLIWWLGISILSFNHCLAQTSQTPPATQATPAPTNNRNVGGSVEDLRRRSVEVDDAFSNLRSLEIQQTQTKSLANVISEDIHPIYRNPSKKDLVNLMPDKALLTQYENFLKQPDTGIFKLSGDANCAQNPKVVVAT